MLKGKSTEELKRMLWVYKGSNATLGRDGVVESSIGKVSDPWSAHFVLEHMLNIAQEEPEEVLYRARYAIERELEKERSMKIKRCPKCHCEVERELPDSLLEYECGSTGYPYAGKLVEQTDRCRLAELERDPRRDCPEIQRILHRMLASTKTKRSKL